MDKNRVRVGIEIGEHTKNPEEFLTVIKENYNTDERVRSGKNDTGRD